MMLIKSAVLSVAFFACSLSSAAAATSAATSGKAASGAVSLRSAAGSKAKGFVQTLRFKHTLRICNAYPGEDVVEVFRAHERITKEDAPLKYRGCAEYNPNLKAGDRLEFHIGGSSAGAFAVSDLPNNDATLLLVAYRHDRVSTAVSFDSHVFANLVNSQIAVLDAYHGDAKGTPKIEDDGESKTERSEELRYDSVVAVNPGEYEVVLVDAEGKAAASADLVALNRESYIVVRCGVEAPDGATSYPQDLIVFPQSDPKALSGNANGVRLSLASAAMMLAALFTGF